MRILPNGHYRRPLHTPGTQTAHLSNFLGFYYTSFELEERTLDTYLLDFLDILLKMRHASCDTQHTAN